MAFSISVWSPIATVAGLWIIKQATGDMRTVLPAIAMTEAALANISTIGSMMVFCVGLNLVWGKKIRVVNLLPALFIAVALAFLPFNF